MGALLGAVILGSSLPTLARGADDYPERLLSLFQATAFYAEYQGGGRQGRLIKWRTPIRAELYGPNARQFEGEITRHLRQLQKLSGLSIRLARPGEREPVNLHIHLYPRWELKKFARYKGACFANMRSNRRFEIVDAEVYIASDQTDLRRHCILEELTQALGLTSDSSLFGTSIFNDKSRTQRLKRWDALMVHILYDSRLTPGMREAEALPLVRQIIRQEVGR